MTKELTMSQKLQINTLLSSDERRPGDVTLGQIIQERLTLSDAEYEELKDDIGVYCEHFFDSRVSPDAYDALEEFGGPILAPPELFVQPRGE